MPITANVVLAVPPLPDNDFWFINADAWENYWNQIPASIEIDPADTTLYAPQAYNDALQPVAINIAGQDYIVVTQDMFTSLKTRLDTLNTNYETLRTELKNAGLITNAQ